VLLLGVAACSRDFASGKITVTEPWTRATPPGASVGAGYMTIANDGARPVRLLGGETPVAEKVEVHAMSMDGGVMRMRPLTNGLEVPAGGEVELKPGGMHLMLIGMKRPLIEGESVAITLVFDGGVRLDAVLSVEGIGGTHGP
jgi:hypothetical protein